MKNWQSFWVKFLAIAAIAVLSQQNSWAIAQPVQDFPATHNMAIVGEKTIYLSHLPVFQEEGKPLMPHRYQVILEATLTQSEDYRQDRHQHQASKIYTLNPEAFVLPDLIALDSPLNAFQVKQIFRGHLERENSVPILQNMRAEINRIIYFQELNTHSTKPASLEYLLFGKDSELFLAHLITAPPDFDQLLSVKVSDRRLTQKELAEGIQLGFPETQNRACDRLQPGQQIVGVTMAQSSAPNSLDIWVEKELYFEEGELNVPPIFETTAAEKRAGFP